MKLEDLVNFFTACGNSLNPNSLSIGSEPVLNHALLANFFASAVLTINENSTLQQQLDDLRSRSQIIPATATQDENRAIADAAKEHELLSLRARVLEQARLIKTLQESKEQVDMPLKTQLQASQHVPQPEPDEYDEKELSLGSQVLEQARSLEKLEHQLLDANQEKAKFQNEIDILKADIAHRGKSASAREKDHSNTVIDLQQQITIRNESIERKALQITHLTRRLFGHENEVEAQRSFGGTERIKLNQEEPRPSTPQSASQVSLDKRRAVEYDIDEEYSHVSSDPEEAVGVTLAIDFGISHDTRHFQMITSERRRKTIEALPRIVDTPDLHSLKIFTRGSLVEDLGGNIRHLLTCVTKSATAMSLKHHVSHYICPQIKHNPWAPSVPGESGYMFVGLGRDSGWFERSSRIDQTFPLFSGVGESNFIYCGTYAAVEDQVLSMEEWKSLPQRVKKTYCQLTKLKGRHVPRLERDCLEHRSGKTSFSILSEDKAAFSCDNPTVDQILQGYNEGIFVVPCIRLQCTGFNWELYQELIPVSTGLAIKSSPARKRRSVVDSPGGGSSTDESPRKRSKF